MVRMIPVVAALLGCAVVVQLTTGQAIARSQTSECAGGQDEFGVPLGGRPILATSDQLQAERIVSQAMADPRVRAAIANVEAQLASDPAARRPEGRATLRRAVETWAASLGYKEVAERKDPAFLIAAEDTPRTWCGHDAPSAGLSGDVPDNLYRQAEIDGAYSYEIRGRVPTNPPTQFSFVIGRNTSTFQSSARSPDLGNITGIVTDRDLKKAADGTFVITIDSQPANGRPNHLQTSPGPLRINFRNTLTDWSQTPLPVTIKRVGGDGSARLLDADALAVQMVEKLPALVRFWTDFKEGWMGPPTPNVLLRPVPRDGGFGYLAGTQFDLADDEVMLITMQQGEAKYMSVQISDRWIITPDNRRVFTSLNNAQAARNADGSVTFVIAGRDPGFVNWISTDGLKNGFTILRWQQTPPNTDTSGLLRDARVVKLADLKAALPHDARWVTPKEREAAIRARSQAYSQRFNSKF
jgi:hypothetical protein